MALDASIIGRDMVAAATGVFNKQWPDIREYAEQEFEDFSRTLVRISGRVAAGQLSEENAKTMVRAQIKSMEIVFLAVQGMGILTVEAAVNAAVDVVRNAVNTAAGIALL
jgi:hypothetical protein